ncbi:MAG: penicillin-binding protein [Flavobacteriales bacterium]
MSGSPTLNKEKKEILWRIYLIYLSVCVFAVYILVKIFIIQFNEGNKLRKKADNLSKEYKKIDASRGNIFSENGKLLATSLPEYDIYIDANTKALTDKIFYDNISDLSDSLAKLFDDRDPESFKKELVKARKNGERYHLVRSSVDYYQLKRMKEFPLFKRGRFKGGFIPVKKSKRKKPFKLLASRTIGYKNERGQSVGLEGGFNSELSGESGKRLMKRVTGDVWMPVNDKVTVKPKNGYDLRSTINVDIQDVAENALLEKLKKHNADHGSVVLMEVKTGNVKAIANLTRSEEGKYHESYNYAIGESTEPGSTFKLPALMAALEDNRVKLNDSVDTENGVHRFYDQVMKDAHIGGFGKISVQEAFEKSSNVGISKVINRSYSKDPQSFIDRLYKMGLNKKLGLNIGGEGEPYIKKTDDPTWSGVSLPWMSIGYEVKQTPLQILTFYNAVANNGTMVKPQFITKVTKGEKVKKKYEPKIINDAICSKSTIEQAKKILKGVVKRGTATNLKKAHFNIAGKTGTAQIANESYGYKYDSEHSYQASFVGYFPANDPKYSCIVVVNAPTKDGYYGNLVAGPIFREIADKVYAKSLRLHEAVNKGKVISADNIPYTKHGHQNQLERVLKRLNIPNRQISPESEWIVSLERDEIIEMNKRSVHKNKVPDVTGMGAKDAVYLLENLGCSVDLKGSGTVINQSLEPGKKIGINTNIILELS